jgi:EAL domain-containing protein (putative c-di-GMP-specific phosphodiesterase class I)
VVAEGIEKQEELDAARELGCDQAQGYFIARPMPEADVPLWLAAHAGAQYEHDAAWSLAATLRP